MATGDKFSLGRLDGKVALITGYNRNIFFKDRSSYWWASRLSSCQNLTSYQSMLYGVCISFVSIFRTALVFRILSTSSADPGGGGGGGGGTPRPHPGKCWTPSGTL